MGHANYTADQAEPTRVMAMKDQKVVSVAAGDGYSLVLTKNGKKMFCIYRLDIENNQ